MEVRVSGKFLDCSRYWQVALVADNSHVGHLEEDAPGWCISISLYHFSCHRRPGSEECKQAGYSNGKWIEDPE
jgi:hypothetical protein